jgi:predicted transcriptional regulator
VEDLAAKIRSLLSKTPGMSIKEISEAIGKPRHFTVGFLAAMEEHGEVYWRKVGTAKIYYLRKK